MAIIKSGGLLGNITGSLGGTTFQNSLSGQIMRVKPVPKKSYNNAQQNIRLIQTRLNYEWAALTDSQRAQWQGKVGTQFKTAKNAYMNANFYRIFYEQTLISTPSFNPLPPPIAPLHLILNLGALFLICDYDAALVDYMMIFKASYPVGKTVTKSRNNLRLLNQDTTDTLSTIISPVYENTVHVTPVVGMKIWISTALQHRTSGDVSAFTTILMEVEAP